jgi:uncharacterized repeat protein (TIGR03803 family)
MSKLSFRGQVSLLVLFATSVLAAPAQTFTKLQFFNGANGANPYVGLTQGRDGSLYGTTIDGGAYGAGNVFKINLSGGLTSLYSFCAQTNCPDGQYPDTVLVLGMDGNFYGTTQSGGTNGGYGTVFKITASGALTTLHSFDAADGAAPYGSLVLAINGDFYGTTNVGGGFGGGNVFKITPGGTLTTLYTFCSQGGCADGQYPVGPLIEGSDGNIYGTTHAGGNNSCTDGCGTVFKITLSGNLTTLHSFDATDGDYPYGGVVEGPAGTFYGTTGGGGADNVGTVFGMTASGKLVTVHSFDVTDGATPYALMLGSDGNFYGTTSAGGSNSRGTVFEITPIGQLTTLHNFAGPDGALVYSGLVQGTNGLFYGTAYFGGRDNDGVVFSLNTGLGPFVTFVQAAGRVGQTVPILGQGFTGTTGVSFGGTPAEFTIVSDTLIKATVPPGAITGFVTVVTPSGTLTSNVLFHVLP